MPRSMLTHGSCLLVIGRLVTACSAISPARLRTPRARGPTAGAPPEAWRSSGTARRWPRGGTRSVARRARRRSRRRRGGGGRRRRSRSPSRAPARRWRPRSCSAVPSTTRARTPSWKPRRATGANEVASRDAVLAHPVAAASRASGRSKERFVAGCSAPSTPSRKSANASDLLGRGTVEDDGRQVEQHAVEQRGPVVLRLLGEVQRERGGAVLEVLQHRLVGGLRVDDLDLRTHVPRAARAPDARWS